MVFNIFKPCSILLGRFVLMFTHYSFLTVSAHMPSLCHHSTHRPVPGPGHCPPGPPIRPSSLPLSVIPTRCWGLRSVPALPLQRPESGLAPSLVLHGCEAACTPLLERGISKKDTSFQGLADSFFVALAVAEAEGQVSRRRPRGLQLRPWACLKPETQPRVLVLGGRPTLWETQEGFFMSN